jgi:hypothetical protein
MNPIGGWYGQKKGLRGLFGVYVPPLMEALGLCELEHFAKNDRVRAKSCRGAPRLSPRRGSREVVVREKQVMAETGTRKTLRRWQRVGDAVICGRGTAMLREVEVPGARP